MYIVAVTVSFIGGENQYYVIKFVILITVKTTLFYTYLTGLPKAMQSS